MSTNWTSNTLLMDPEPVFHHIWSAGLRWWRGELTPPSGPTGASGFCKTPGWITCRILTHMPYHPDFCD